MSKPRPFNGSRLPAMAEGGTFHQGFVQQLKGPQSENQDGFYAFPPGPSPQKGIGPFENYYDAVAALPKE